MTPIDPKNPKPDPEHAQEPENAQENVKQPEPNQTAEAAQRKPLNLPDWQPLGTVRDYFNEQMKQDYFR